MCSHTTTKKKRRTNTLPGPTAIDKPRDVWCDTPFGIWSAGGGTGYAAPLGASHGPWDEFTTADGTEHHRCDQHTRSRYQNRGFFMNSVGQIQVRLQWVPTERPAASVYLMLLEAPGNNVCLLQIQQESRLQTNFHASNRRQVLPLPMATKTVPVGTRRTAEDNTRCEATDGC